MAVGEAMIKYPGTDQWLYLGFDPDLVEEKQLATVYCRMLGYNGGEVW